MVDLEKGRAILGHAKPVDRGDPCKHLHLQNMRLLFLKQFLENSSIHGFKHLVQTRDCHWIERLFWIIICGLSWYGCAVIIVSLFDEFINRPLAITAETSYLNWVTPFPTLVLCTSFSKEANEYAVKIIDSRGSNGRRFSTKLLMGEGYVEELDGVLTAEDLISIYSKAKVNCSNIFSECTWNGRSFNCCDEFGLLESPAGFCYMLNSVHTRLSNEQSRIKFIVNRVSRQAYLSVNFTDQFSNWFRKPELKVYFLNNYDIPTLTSGDNKIVKKDGMITGIDFTIEDIVNDEGVKSLSPDKRECRFSDENDHNSIYKHYSYEGCIIDLTIKHMLGKCGCVSFRYPRKAHMRVCNMTEMGCILNLKEKSGLAERECLPDCDGSFIHAYAWKSPQRDSKVGGLRIKLLSTPFVRFRRYIVHSTLDLIGIYNSIL
ncbi:pickpocket protein 11-like [Belonocnema kinseyi]|uniref:pickpocket protein 11-like n=1 Tax=Belonocnema kinseyi TaxID=2817044 RepID=UPI00143D54B3|nr:pickpocket protein 11-like [Belonocnema kinseyi]